MAVHTFSIIQLILPSFLTVRQKEKKYAWSAWIIKAECQTAHVIKRNISNSLKKRKVFLGINLHN